MYDFSRHAPRVAAFLCMSFLLAACGVQRQAVYPTRDRGDADAVYGERPSVLGPGGGTIFGGRSSQEEEAAAGGGIGVNSFLWRAALDTVSFMPVASADPFGGVILTDWYTPPESPRERFKTNVYILDRQLRADGVRVSVFRQELDERGNWRDAPVAANTAANLENAILTRARQIRIAQAPAR